MEARKWAIILCCLFASSIEPILVKIGFINGATAFSLILLRTTFAGIVALLLNIRDLKNLCDYQILKKILPLALLHLNTNSLVMIALVYANPSLVITILKLTPVGVGVFSFLLGRENINVSFWIGLGMCMLGVSLSTNMHWDLHSLTINNGLIFAFLAMLSSTTYRVKLGHLTQEIPSKTISSLIFLINGSITTLLLPFVFKDINVQTTLTTLWSGLAAVCANMAFVYAISLVGSARMSLIDLMQRPLVILLSMFVLDEVLESSQILGIVLVLLGVYIANRYRNLTSIPKQPIEIKRISTFPNP